ncbi:hypothetical protein D9M68_414590 [compost metagenome]
MQFVAAQVLVDVAGLDDIRVLQLRRPQLVVVVRDVHFLLADQLPVVAIGRAVVQVGVVGGTHAVGGGARAVIGDLRGTAHATLAGVVGPGQARLLDLVDGLVDQRHGTGQARRRHDFLLHVEQVVGRLLRVEVGHVLREGRGLAHLHGRERAAGLRSHLGDDAIEVAAAETGQVVPHHFDAALRNREGVEAGLLEVLQAVAVVHALGRHRALLRRVIDGLRGGGAAAGRIDRDLVGIRIALEHGQLAFGQLVLVPGDVGGSDGEQRLVGSERIAHEAIGIDRSGVRLQPAGPGRDAAVGIARLFGAQRRQAGAQPGRLVRRNGRHRAGGHDRQGQNAHFHHCCFHTAVPVSCCFCIRKLTPGWNTAEDSRRSRDIRSKPGRCWPLPVRELPPRYGSGVVPILGSRPEPRIASGYNSSLPQSSISIGDSGYRR